MKSSYNSNQLADIAIAHDYLTQRGGAERVVLSLMKAFPQATIYTTLYDPENTYPEFKEANIVVSPLNKLSVFRRNHRLALPLLPIASSLLKVPAQKTIVSSTGWAHGFRFAGESLVYCHSPARWLYLSEQYLGDNSKKPIELALKVLRPFLTVWDKRAAAKAGPYLANSTLIKERIYQCYGKASKVVHPPHSVSVDGTQKCPSGLEELTGKDFFLIVSRLLPYKNIDKAIEAFNQLPNEQLLIIGAGPEENNLKSRANQNISFASNLTDAEMRYAYANCKALLAVSFEDFGLTPVEAGAFGKPSIALKAGGYLDTIKDGINGTFIDQISADSIREKVEQFDSQDFSVEQIKKYNEFFSEESFISKIKGLI